MSVLTLCTPLATHCCAQHVCSNQAQDKFIFSLQLAASAEEAMAVLHSEVTFNLILLDVLMPQLNGYAVLPEMRRLVGDTVAIVMTSAHSHEQLIQRFVCTPLSTAACARTLRRVPPSLRLVRCILDGADTYLLKPLQMEAVKNIWQYCLLKDPGLASGRQPAQGVGVGGTPPSLSPGGGLQPAPVRATLHMGKLPAQEGRWAVDPDPDSHSVDTVPSVCRTQ